MRLNATFSAPQYQPGGLDRRAALRRDGRVTYQRSGDGLPTPGPLRLTGRVWRDDQNIPALHDELDEIREAVAACTEVIRVTNGGTYTYHDLAGGPPPAITPDGLGGWEVVIELWPGRPEPTYIPQAVFADPVPDRLTVWRLSAAGRGVGSVSPVISDFDEVFQADGARYSSSNSSSVHFIAAPIGRIFERFELRTRYYRHAGTVNGARHALGFTTGDPVAFGITQADHETFFAGTRRTSGTAVAAVAGHIISTSGSPGAITEDQEVTGIAHSTLTPYRQRLVVNGGEFAWELSTDEGELMQSLQGVVPFAYAGVHVGFVFDSPANNLGHSMYVDWLEVDY